MIVCVRRALSIARSIVLVAACFAAASGLARAASVCRADNLIFTTSSANTNVYAFDPTTTAAPTLVGQSSFISAAAARNPTDGKVYSINEATGATAPTLGSFDPVTKTAGTTVAITGVPTTHGTFVRAGFDSAGNLYAGDNTLTQIFQIDTTTGAATTIAVNGIVAGAGDLAFDPSTPNTYYTVVQVGTSYDFYKVVVSGTTATATRVGSTGVASTVSLYGIAFGNDGVLYAGDQATVPTQLYAINLATGAATFTGRAYNIVGGINDFATLPTPQTVDLGVVKTHTTNPVYPGGSIAYQLKVTNNSPTATGCQLQSFTLTDALPATLTATSYTPSAGTYNASTGAWTGVALDPGTSVTLTIVATVAATASGTIANTGTVATPGGSPGIPDPVAGNNSSTDNATVTPLANLTVAKTGPTTAAVNGLVSYSIVVSNPGPSAANGTTLSDPIPSGVTIVGTPRCTTTSGSATCGAVTVSGSTVSSTIPTLPPNSSVTFAIFTKATAAGSVTNTATITPPSGVADQSATTSSATTNVTTNGGFAKTVRNVTAGESGGVTADTGKPGDTLEYALSYTNTANAALASFSVSDVVPASTTFVSASCGTLPTGVTGCSISAPTLGATGTVTYAYTGSLAVGATASFLLRVKIV